MSGEDAISGEAAASGDHMAGRSSGLLSQRFLRAAQGRVLAADAREGGFRRTPDALWSLPRIEAAAAIWGAGLITPFSAAEAAALSDTLGLCGRSQVLLIGAGPGGIEQRMRAASGAEITAYEAHPLLADLGGAHSFNPQRPDFGRQGYDAAIIIEGLAGLSAQDLLAATAFALRPGGRVFLSATLADPEPLAHALRHLRCKVEALEDGTQGRLLRLRAEWVRVVRRIERSDAATMLPEARSALLHEVARWQAGMAGLSNGRLRHIQMTAQGRGIGRVGAQMADAA